MEPKKILDLFEQGSILYPDIEVEAAKKPWYEHPLCKGVFLKDLVTGGETGGKFSYHLVRIWKDCEVLRHDHETQWELNVVLDGKGVFYFENREIQTEKGQVFVTPPKIHHTVSAGTEDLSLLAVFIPALV